VVAAVVGQQGMLRQRVHMLNFDGTVNLLVVLLLVTTILLTHFILPANYE
jgi:hypothetical protein